MYIKVKLTNISLHVLPPMQKIVSTMHETKLKTNMTRCLWWNLQYVLAHLSWKLNWASLIACRPSVCKLYTFSSSQETLGKFQPFFQPFLAQNILELSGFKIVRMKGHALFQGEIITKLRKYIDEIYNHFAKV